MIKFVKPQNDLTNKATQSPLLGFSKNGLTNTCNARDKSSFLAGMTANGNNA